MVEVAKGKEKVDLLILFTNGGARRFGEKMGRPTCSWLCSQTVAVPNVWEGNEDADFFTNIVPYIRRKWDRDLGRK
jgi:hypothetical protein